MEIGFKSLKPGLCVYIYSEATRRRHHRHFGSTHRRRFSSQKKLKVLGQLKHKLICCFSIKDMEDKI